MVMPENISKLLIPQREKSNSVIATTVLGDSPTALKDYLEVLIVVAVVVQIQLLVVVVVAVEVKIEIVEPVVPHHFDSKFIMTKSNQSNMQVLVNI